MLPAAIVFVESVCAFLDGVDAFPGSVDSDVTGVGARWEDGTFPDSVGVDETGSVIDGVGVKDVGLHVGAVKPVVVGTES